MEVIIAINDWNIADTVKDTRQSIHQSINQSINKSINQSINQFQCHLELYIFGVLTHQAKKIYLF